MTTPPAVAPQILDFYEHTADEGTRLTGPADGRLEYQRTRELLARHLPAAPADVLDVGGGTGIHARWLTEDGYRVRLVDPVPRHVKAATDAGITAEQGDARALTAADATADVVLLLGPLYHLQDRDDRARALAEAARVTRPGGLVAAAAISRHSALFEQTACARLDRPAVRAAVASILDTARHNGPGFTLAYFHTPDELAAEVRAAGLDDVTVYGIEGPAWSMLRAVEQAGGDAGPGTALYASALEAARLSERHPALMAAGSHLLAVARRP